MKKSQMEPIRHVTAPTEEAQQTKNFVVSYPKRKGDHFTKARLTDRCWRCVAAVGVQQVVQDALVGPSAPAAAPHVHLPRHQPQHRHGRRADRETTRPINCH